jgi:hypothetical protein
MHGEKRGADMGDAFHALRNSVSDIVQFEIEKDLVAGAHQRLREFKAAGERKLISDLVERYGPSETIDHGSRACNRRHIKRNDEAMTRVHGCQVPGCQVSGIRNKGNECRVFYLLIPDY